MLTDLLLGLGDGLVQHEGEVLNLPFQEVVVQGEGPQGRLQTQQVQAYSCNPREEASANHNQLKHQNITPAEKTLLSRAGRSHI